ncbi:MAG: hypothetical protein ACFB21_10420 [Opitutales bacterium]
MVKLTFCLLICVLATLVLDARPRTLNDLGGRSDLSDQVKPKDVKETEMAEGFENRIDFQDYHTKFSEIGTRRTSLLERDPANLNTEVQKMDRFPSRRGRWSTDQRYDSERVEVRDWNRLREDMFSHQFSRTELRTPEARRIQDMVDRISLQELNRFTAIRNQMTDGVPEVQAGSEQPVSFMGSRTAEVSGGRSMTPEMTTTTPNTSGPGEGWTTESPWKRNETGIKERVTTSVRLLPAGE